jgi:CubicO group peptidase (beta-lactamase class C family)
MDLNRVVGRLDTLIAEMLHVARIPGAGIAIVADGEIVLTKGYGYRDLDAKLPVTPETIYPIASTTKALNATLIGMLVDEGKLSWDVPVREYLPGFRLSDASASTAATLRDLLSMRTGLPRHDWMWLENPLARSELVRRLRYLEPSAGFREKFQYNNLTATVAGYIAEVTTGKDWEQLIRERILEPLEMRQTRFDAPGKDRGTRSYHEDEARGLCLTHPLATQVTAPSGGAIYSTVGDMARWLLFNMNGGKVGDTLLIQAETLQEIQSPQVPARTDPTCPTPQAAYAMGWFVDTWGGRGRLTHGGYLHDVNSEVTLYPETGLGVVSFTNFGAAGLARLMNQYVLDLTDNRAPGQTFADRLEMYEGSIAENRIRAGDRVARRVGGTSPSHALQDYAGTYSQPGYGEVDVTRDADKLVLTRNRMILILEHWHYDAWLATASDLPRLHAPHPFDRANLLLFEMDADGDVDALLIRFEPAVGPIRFVRQQHP